MVKSAWIEIIDEKEATGRSNIARAAGLWPELLEAQEGEAGLFEGPGTELDPEIKELIAALVAQLNNSDYFSHRYRAALKSRNWSDEKITHILQDIKSYHLNDHDKAVLVFADKITRHPQSMDQNDVAALKAAGLSDRAILEAAAVAGYFNYMTRLAAALGVMPEEEKPRAA